MSRGHSGAPQASDGAMSCTCQQVAYAARAASAARRGCERGTPPGRSAAGRRARWVLSTWARERAARCGREDSHSTGVSTGSQHERGVRDRVSTGRSLPKVLWRVTPPSGLTHGARRAPACGHRAPGAPQAASQPQPDSQPAAGPCLTWRLAGSQGWRGCCSPCATGPPCCTRGPRCRSSRCICLVESKRRVAARL